METPRKYQLQWLSTERIIAIHVYNKTVSEFPEIKPHVYEFHLGKNNITNFSWDLSKDKLGYNNSIFNYGEKDGYLTLAVPLPVIRELYDGNKKEKYETKWDNALPSVLNIDLILGLCMCVEENFGDKKKEQLVTIMHMSTEQGMSTAGFGGTFHQPFRKWLQTELGGQEYKESFDIITAMIGAYGHMWSESDSEIYRDGFRADINSDDKDLGRLCLECPGMNSCSIFSNPDEFLGRFTNHNVDNYLQQLTLLAGLAQTCSMADRALYH